MLLIHNNQPKIAQWQEQAGACTQNYGCRIYGRLPLCILLLLHGIILQNLVDSGFLRSGLFGVESKQPLPKHLLQAALQLLAYGNFRNHIKDILPLAQLLKSKGNVNLCLAAAGNTPQKDRFPRSSSMALFNLVISYLLYSR